MKKTVFYCFVLYATIFSSPVLAQPGVSANAIVVSADDLFRQEQEKFLQNLKSSPVDSAIVQPISRHSKTEINTIYTSVTKLPVIEKEKAIRSMVFFLQALGKNIDQIPSDIYDIPGALRSYRNVLTALLQNKPLSPVLQPLPAKHSQLVAVAFSQYKEHILMDDVAVYKRMANKPEYILQFLESKPTFRYADSLLLEAAAYDPMKLVYWLKKNKGGIREKLGTTRNIYLAQIVSLVEDKNVSELLPFVKQMAEQKMGAQEIFQQRADVLNYFQLLVNTLQDAKRSSDASSIFIAPLRSGIKQKSLAFFVNEINDLHNSADAIRFASVKNLRPVDLYYVITSCGEEMYTSSYLGLYKRLMEHYKDKPVDSLFEMVQYDNLRVFMRLAANYNVLPDFLGRLPKDKVGDLVKRFMSGVETDSDTGLEKAMDIADSFTAFASTAETSDLAKRELHSNLARCQAGQQYLGVRLYSILSQVYTLVQQEGGLQKLWAILGNYEMLKRNALQNKNGEIVQLVLFYGDDDGVASFNNFLKFYTDEGKWTISKTANWVSIRSQTDQPVVIYANQPLDIEEELDIKAQDSLVDYLLSQSLEPTVLVHRGHSYHLDKTLKRLKPSVKLAILGSCGGYNKSLSIASINPDVQVVGSKKTGAKSINDPIIELINETLVNRSDISWPEIWKTLQTRFSKDKTTLGLFNEYFPPSTNISLFVLKLFMNYRRGRAA